MNKIIQFFRKIFCKKVLTLSEGSNNLKTENSSNKEIFINNIKVETDDELLQLQIKLENGSLSEEELNTDQIKKLKNLYYEKILELIDSLNNYKLKLVK